MNFELSDEQELIRRTVREFAETKVAPVAEELDREERFPYDLVRELGELGLMGLPVPEEYGGAGADTVSYAIAVEELTRIDSSVAITMAAHTSLGTMRFEISSSPVRAVIVTQALMSVPAFVMKIFEPSITHSPSRSSAFVRVAPASEPASGSVSPNAARP